MQTKQTGVHDDGDDAAVEAGMRPWDQHGANITEDQFYCAVVGVVGVVDEDAQARADEKTLTQAR